MRSSSDERAPLLQFSGSNPQFEDLPDAYQQFSELIGNRPVDLPSQEEWNPPHDTLYHRAVEHRKWQGRMYAFSSAVTNTLLLSQIVLGAALTGLGASRSSPVLVTIFGALNTIIAGVITFLKSRGQPMRARMFRDDLSRVIDEIENSATMWRGISRKAHGYDAIDTDDAVTVRSEVARLTRLYDRAVRTNTMNDPDNYGNGPVGDSGSSGLRSRTGQPLLAAMPASTPLAQTPAAAAVASGSTLVIPAPPAADPDESPATKSTAVKKEEEPAKDDATKQPPDAKPAADQGTAQPEAPKAAEPPSASASGAPASELPPDDPDASPATQAVLKSSNSETKPATQSSETDQATAGASS